MVSGIQIHVDVRVLIRSGLELIWIGNGLCHLNIAGSVFIIARNGYCIDIVGAVMCLAWCGCMCAICILLWHV